ncbi:MAG: hypothetical protein AB1630_01120 [bacterium]
MVIKEFEVSSDSVFKIDWAMAMADAPQIPVPAANKKEFQPNLKPLQKQWSISQNCSYNHPKDNPQNKAVKCLV